ncbi:hypothetical protein CBS101457_006938 [Exobasidium rhododendri]|nr:hypothetical protein CBS101457_006938 [Exobasidium rhododendri]
MLATTSLSCIFTVLVALAGQTQAAPSTKRRTCKAESSITANFDDQSYALGTVLPAASPVGTYKGLEYNAFVGYMSTELSGVLPHSPSNEILTGLPQTTTDGTAYIGATGSTTYFDFKSFYFGCAVDSVTGAVAVPTACTVVATGFYEGKEKIVQEFNYTPDNILAAGQNKAKTQYSKCHTGFTGVDKVEFTSTNPTLDIVLLDDITYVPHTCTS